MNSRIMKTSGKTLEVSTNKLICTNTYSALELEAATALLMLRYQYDIKTSAAGCAAAQTTTPPPPPPAAATGAVSVGTGTVEADKWTPKEQVRCGPVKVSAQPLKKRSIPPHLLRRSLTPARATVAGGNSNINSSSSSNGSGIIKAKLKVPVAPCNKALLKSCRNMIREFLDNQELI